MLKKNIRKFFLAKRRKITNNNLGESLISDSLVRLFSQRGWTGSQRIHCFLPIVKKGEIDSFRIVNSLWHKYPRLEVWVPANIDYSGNRMGHARWNRGDPLVCDKWGIPTPADRRNSSGGTRGSIKCDFDVVLVPMLAFDQRGHRDGYGKGYYDRFLAGVEARRACKIGLNLDPALTQLISDVDPERDVTMDIVVTPEKVYYF